MDTLDSLTKEEAYRRIVEYAADIIKLQTLIKVNAPKDVVHYPLINVFKSIIAFNTSMIRGFINNIHASKIIDEEEYLLISDFIDVVSKGGKE